MHTYVFEELDKREREREREAGRQTDRQTEVERKRLDIRNT